MNKETDFCTPTEISKSLGISRSTFWRWRDLPGFPKPMKIGMRQMHFSLGEVKQFLSDADVLTSERKAADPIACAAASVGLRDYFAAKAMQGICAHDDNWGCDIDDIAEQSYAVADAMLRARVRP